jgi:hypothetical protein
MIWRKPVEATGGSSSPDPSSLSLQKFTNASQYSQQIPLFFLQSLDLPSKPADFETQLIDEAQALAPVGHRPGVLGLVPASPLSHGAPES